MGEQMSDTSSAENTVAPASQRVRRQVEDALELANFAISTGAKGADGQPLSFDDIGTIQFAAAQIGLIDVPTVGGSTLTIDQWNKFEQAYYRLAVRDEPGDGGDAARHARYRAPARHYAHVYYRVRDAIWGYSPAQRFTREMWFLTFALGRCHHRARMGRQLSRPEEGCVSVASWRFLWQSLVPWAYGALGACAFLLRSAHYFIHQRTLRHEAYAGILQPHPARRDLGRRDHPVHRIPDQRRRRIGRASRRGRARLRRRLQRRSPVQHWSSVSLPRYFRKSRPTTTPERRLLRKSAA